MKLNLLTSGLKHAFPGGASGQETACQCRRCKRSRFNGKFCVTAVWSSIWEKVPGSATALWVTLWTVASWVPAYNPQAKKQWANNFDLLQFSHKKRGFDHIYCEFIMGGIKNAQFSSVTQLHLTLCDLKDCSTSDFPVHHQLLELAQTHVH